MYNIIIDAWVERIVNTYRKRNNNVNYKRKIMRTVYWQKSKVNMPYICSVIALRQAGKKKEEKRLCARFLFYLWHAARVNIRTAENGYTTFHGLPLSYK